jgi:beta-galactosidase
MVNPSQQLDFERFGSEALKALYIAERDAIENICPDKPFTTNFMVSTDQCVMDYADWSDDVDFVSNDHYFTAGDSHVDELLCSDALMDSLSLRKPWYVMEHSTSAVQWKPLNSRKRAGELIRDALAHVAMGADAVNFFQWRQSRSGAEAFHSSMVPHAGENTKVFREVCELGSILQELSAAGLQGSELEECDTAIIFDAESEWATRCQTLPSMNLNHWHDVREWYRALLDAGRRADVVPLRADWSGYHTVILPSVLALSAGQTRRLARFVRDGGTLVVGFATGIIDERFHVGLGGYPGAGEGLLRAVLGVRSEEFNILGEPEDCVQVHPQDCTQERKACSDIEKGNRGVHTDESVQESAKDHDPAMIRLSNGFTSRLWANVVTSLEPTATVLATYEGPEAREWELDGIPAIVRNAYGSGQAYYIGCDLERTDISRLLGLLNIDTASKTNAGMVHVRRTTKTECFDFYINRSCSSITIEGIQGSLVVAYRSTFAQSNAYVSNTYVIERNGILITKQEY